MTLNCRLNFRDNKVESVTSPIGGDSLLYRQLVEKYGEEDGLDMMYIAASEDAMASLSNYLNEQGEPTLQALERYVEAINIENKGEVTLDDRSLIRTLGASLNTSSLRTVSENLLRIAETGVNNTLLDITPQEALDLHHRIQNTEGDISLPEVGPNSIISEGEVKTIDEVLEPHLVEVNTREEFDEVVNEYAPQEFLDEYNSGRPLSTEREFSPTTDDIRIQTTSPQQAETTTETALDSLVSRLGETKLASEVEVVNDTEARRILSEVIDTEVTETVNGFVHNNKVYINSDKATLDTPIHEFSHLYNLWLKENSPEKYKKGLELVEAEIGNETSEIRSAIDYVLETQPNLEGEALHEEILAQAVRERGLDIIKSNSESGLANWLRDVWNSIKNMLGLSTMTVGQVLDMNIGEYTNAVATDLLSGEFVGENGEANYLRWKGRNKEVSGVEVQSVKTGSPIVAKVFHGTTNTFYEFDSTKKGNIEGHLGKINYFTTDYQDASINYQADGVDLTNRVQRFAEDVEKEIDSSNYYEVDGELSYEAIAEDYGIELNEINGEELEVVAEAIARNELVGGEERVLEVYVKLNNPVVLGRGESWFDALNIDEMYIDEATTEIAENYDITETEAKRDYDYEVRELAMELQGDGNVVIEALSKALNDNGYDSTQARELLGDNFYEAEVNLDNIENAIRRGELYDNYDGELASSQVVADFFENLGFDGIILTNVSERFTGMGLGRGTSHVHVFDSFANQIKLSDGSNTTFGESRDIRYQTTQQTPGDAELFLSDSKNSPRVRGVKLFTKGDTEVSYRDSAKHITLELIHTPQEARGGGQAQSAMNDLVAYADQTRKPIYLDVVPRDSETNESRLRGFYERNGFTFDDSMVGPGSGIPGTSMVRYPKRVTRTEGTMADIMFQRHMETSVVRHYNTDMTPATEPNMMTEMLETLNTNKASNLIGELRAVYEKPTRSINKVDVDAIIEAGIEAGVNLSDMNEVLTNKGQTSLQDLAGSLMYLVESPSNDTLEAATELYTELLPNKVKEKVTRERLEGTDTEVIVFDGHVDKRQAFEEASLIEVGDGIYKRVEAIEDSDVARRLYDDFTNNLSSKVSQEMITDSKKHMTRAQLVEHVMNKPRAESEMHLRRFYESLGEEYTDRQIKLQQMLNDNVVRERPLVREVVSERTIVADQQSVDKFHENKLKNSIKNNAKYKGIYRHLVVTTHGLTLTPIGERRIGEIMETIQTLPVNERNVLMDAISQSRASNVKALLIQDNTTPVTLDSIVTNAQNNIESLKEFDGIYEIADGRLITKDGGDMLLRVKDRLFLKDNDNGTESTYKEINVYNEGDIVVDNVLDSIRDPRYLENTSQESENNTTHKNQENKIKEKEC